MDEWTNMRMNEQNTDLDIRHFGWDDAPALVDLINAVAVADGTDTTTTLKEFRQENSGPLARPERDFLLAVHNDQVVASASAWMGGREDEPNPTMPLILRIHPDYRGHGIGARLLDMALTQGRELGAAIATSPVRSQEPTKRDLLLAQGFTFARYWWSLRAGLAELVDMPPLPAGFRVRPYQGHQDDAPLATLMSNVFSTHYLDRTYTVADVRHWTADGDFDPGLLELAVADQSGELAGYVWAWIDPARNERTGERVGFIGDLGLRAAYRGRGLGRWLLRRTMADLRERGMDWAELEVDGTNDRARQLYDSEGFQVREEIQWYEKQLRGDVDA